jgi:hypothetical protein
MTTAATDLRVLAPEAATDFDGRGIRHPLLVRELALTCWADANGNADRARRLLLDACQRDRTGQLPQDEDAIPSANTIRRWARREGWELRLIDTVGGNFGHLLKFHAARMVRLHEQCIDVLDEVTSPGYVPTQHDKVRVDAAKHVTNVMAQTLAILQTGQEALAQHASTKEPEQEFADAAEANRFWIKGRTTSA